MTLRRVLMTADTVGGVWTYALELTRALAPHGVDVVLATMGAPLSPSQREEADALENLDVAESAFRLEWMQEPWTDVRRAGEWLVSLAREVRPDVVHLNGYAHGALAFDAPKVVVAHSCVASWFRAVKGVDAPAEWDRYRREVTRGLDHADAVVAPSRAMLDAIETHYGPRPGGVVIHNGRDRSRFAPRPKERFVLSVGRLWDEAKNVQALADVAPGLDCPVFVAGDVTSPDGAHRKLANVEALGRLAAPALADWMGRAAIYALPARYEPFGLSVLEAALSGCALVLGDVASLRELWSEAALFVPPDDRRALADTLRNLLARGDLRAHLAGRARERADTLSLERMGTEYLSLYTALVDRGAAENRRARRDVLSIDRL